MSPIPRVALGHRLDSKLVSTLKPKMNGAERRCENFDCERDAYRSRCPLIDIFQRSFDRSSPR